MAEGKPWVLDVYGSKGMMSLNRRGFKIYPEMKGKAPAMEALEIKTGGYGQDEHARNFLDCIKSRNRPNADVEEGHRTAVMCHLGNISTQLGRSIKWDAAKEQIVGDPQANQMLTRPYRGSWKLS